VYSWNPTAPIPSVSAWDEAFTALHGASRISVPDHAATWAARLEWQKSQTYGLALCGGGEQQVTRQQRHIRTDPRGTYELIVPLAGSAFVEQGPATAEIGPTDIALCDIDQPFTFAHDAGFRSIALIVSRQDIARRSRATTREPQLIAGSSGLGRIIRQLITTLQQEREKLFETAFDTTCDKLLDLVCLAAEGDDTAPGSHRRSVEADVRRHIRLNAGDRDLDVNNVARALGWSPRYIQQVLQAANTTSRDLIRQERLQLARTRLASSQWADSSIAQIAHSCGFSSHAVFTTAFRREFGRTPRDVRQAT